VSQERGFQNLRDAVHRPLYGFVRLHRVRFAPEPGKIFLWIPQQVLLFFMDIDRDMVLFPQRIRCQHMVEMAVTFDVHNNEELNSIIEKVRQVESVIDIQRSRG